MRTKGKCDVSGKTCYLSFTEASIIATNMTKSHRSDTGYHMGVYECRFCKYFHIGSQQNIEEDSPDIKFYSSLEREEIDELLEQRVKHVSYKGYKKKKRPRRGEDI